ncbi:adenylyl-sulfate kinase [Paraburkholderia phenazinium]|uniref:Adenylyl-sulfate kinase n=1 Tax=Paraburkholderia phenazinium TaxID=60549 RepID=A0A1N6GPS2_9BURK|nr:adenylyl-sulfate kinase [Paraburkholderia phenazinium]SIO09529.1 adenylylsulfate kinase [Paraburkholderia phenazinium]
MAEDDAGMLSARASASAVEHSSAVFWLTGLSGAGKSTLAFGAEKTLKALGYRVCVLDGDRLRTGLNRDLGFSEADRMENMRRVAEVATLFADVGVVVIVALISPLAEGRELARRVTGRRFHEIYLAADLGTCEARDPKGLYRRARAGEIAGFTGIGSAYDIPLSPDAVIDTCSKHAASSVADLVTYIRSRIELR